jgi:hypothetical protein
MPDLQFKRIIFLILIITMFVSCKKKDAYIFFEKNYYSVFDEKLKSYEAVKKIFYRDFFKVHDVKLKNLNFISSEIKKITGSEGSVLFLENIFLPLTVEEGNFEINREIKILTYDIPDDISLNFKNLIYNVEVDDQVYDNKIFNLMKSHSRTKDMSDCGIIVTSSYYSGIRFVEFLKEKKMNPQTFEINPGNYNDIDNWLNSSKKNIIVFFANINNNVILEKEKSFDKKCKYIEVFTDFGKISNIIDYNVSIKWDETFKYALTQKQFKNFINFTVDDFVKANHLGNNKYNAKVNLSSLVNIRKIKRINITIEEEKKDGN